MKREPVNLRIPGPTPCPEEVLQAGARPMVNHRGSEFKALLTGVHGRLQQLFETKNDIILLTTSGTGGLEAAVVNTLSPGDRLLVISIGVFGDRFAQAAKAYGADVVKLDFPWGTAADPDQVRQALQQDPSIKAVAVTHNETSTGVTNDLEAISKVVREFEKLLLVDAISSLGCIPLPVDAWGIDVAVTASQKGFMVPPGLAFASVSPRAWEATKVARMPRFYFDFGRHKTMFERGETPWTPAVSLFSSLDVALDRMLREGLKAIFQRHARLGQKTRQGVKGFGLSLFPADERYASNTVTAVRVPEGINAKETLGLLQREHNVVLGDGQASLNGKILRIGHMGYVSERDIEAVLEALQASLTKLRSAPLASR